MLSKGKSTSIFKMLAARQQLQKFVLKDTTSKQSDGSIIDKLQHQRKKKKKEIGSNIVIMAFAIISTLPF